MNHDNCRIYGCPFCRPCPKPRKFREGDLVQVTKGEQIVRGRLEKTIFKLQFNDRLKLENFRYFIDAAEVNGWTVTLIEAAPEPKPFTTGEFYTDKDGDIWFAEGEDWADLRSLVISGNPARITKHSVTTIQTNAPFRRVTLNPQATVVEAP